MRMKLLKLDISQPSKQTKFTEKNTSNKNFHLVAIYYKSEFSTFLTYT